MSKMTNAIDSMKSLIDSNTIILINNKPDYYIRVECNSKLFRISEMIFNCIVLPNINDKKYPIEAESLIADKLIELYDAVLLSSKSSDSKYIYANIRVFSQDTVCAIANCIKFLFKKQVLIIAIPLASLASLIFTIIIGSNAIVLTNWSDIISTYLILLFVLVIHEFGHSTASMYYGIKPKEIGFGFYFIFPVLYANVTDIWLLKKHKRIMVNFAGIYIQLIVNFIFILMYLITSNKVFAQAIMTSNIICAYTLLPFFRNDGYWIYSDFFEKPNLIKDHKFYFLKIKFREKIDYVLLFFSVGNALFIAYIIYIYIAIGTSIYKDICQLFKINNYIFSDMLLILAKAIVFIIFLALYIKRLYKQISKLTIKSN